MRASRLIAAIGASLLLVVSAVAVWAGQSGDADDIAHALNAYAAAVTSKSVEAVGEWVTEDLLIFEGAGVNRGLADYRDRHLVP